MEKEQVLRKVSAELSKVELERDEALVARLEVVATTWQDDQDAKSCRNCGTEFSISKRKVS